MISLTRVTRWMSVGKFWWKRFLLEISLPRLYTYTHTDGRTECEDKDNSPALCFILSPGCIVDQDTNYLGSMMVELYAVPVATQQACADLAASIDGALLWSFSTLNNKCFGRTSDAGRTHQSGVVSGNIQCASMIMFFKLISCSFMQIVQRFQKCSL